MKLDRISSLFHNWYIFHNWFTSLIFITFANRVAIDYPDERKKQVYKSKLAEMKRQLKTAMRQAGISEPIANATFVCEAGHPTKKQLPIYDYDWTCLFLVNA